MARRRLSAAHKAAISRSLRRKLGPTTGLDEPKPAEKKPKSVSAAPAAPKVPKVAQAKGFSHLHEADRQLNHLRAPKRDVTPKKFTLSRVSDTYSPEMNEQYQEAFAENDWFGDSEQEFVVEKQAERIAEALGTLQKRGPKGKAARATVERLREDLRQVLADPQPRIAFPPGAVAGLLAKGEFVNAADVATMDGMEGNRHIFEDVMLGGPQRPIFGLFRRGPMDDNTDQYGVFRAVLYPDKAQEATFSLGDSLLEQSIPQRVADFDGLSDEQLLSGAAYNIVADVRGGRKMRSGSSHLETVRYIEAEFHQGVSLADVHHIEINEIDYDDSPAIQDAIKQLQAHGFEVRINTQAQYEEWAEANGLQNARFG